MTDITVGSLSFLLSLAEGVVPGTTADMLAERTGADGQRLVSAGMFQPGPNRTMIDVELSNGDGVAMIEDDPTTKGFRCFHPEDGYISLEPERLRTWRLSLPELALQIARMLGMPSSFRPKELVDDLLWDLGTPRLGTRKGLPILFGVRLAEPEVRSALKKELALRQGTQSALMLSSAPIVAEDIVLPKIMRVVPVLDIFDRQQPGAKTSVAVLDRNRLGALAVPRPTHADKIGAPVQCSPDGAWLRIHSLEFTFRGRKKRLIRLLFEARESGSEWVGEEWLLAEADYDSKRIEDVFKDRRPDKRKAWRQYIDVHDGMVRLNIPDKP